MQLFVTDMHLKMVWFWMIENKKPHGHLPLGKGMLGVAVCKGMVHICNGMLDMSLAW